MANKNLFKTGVPSRVVKANTVNKAGGTAYQLSDAEALCQYAVTSTFSDVFYASGKEQLDDIKGIVDRVDPVIIAKAAVYGHENGKMKDVPAYLLAVLAAKGEIELLRAAWDRVITSPKMLLNFVQIVRSGVTGRKSFGSAVKSLIQGWINSRRGNKLFQASIGHTDPSLVDVIKMVHPRPNSPEQNALFGYLLGKSYDADNLPPLVKEFEAFKADNSNPLPDMDYRALTNCDLTKDHWKLIAQQMPWNALRLNLNTLARNGVFDDEKVTRAVAAKLANKEEVRKWNAFPYQLMTTFQNIKNVPQKIQLALQDALEIATENVPQLGERVAVCSDVSGSMSSTPVTGSRPGQPATKTMAIHVAALMASAIARTNPETTVISFGSNARVVPGFNPRDSVITNASKLAFEGNVVGHGTEAAQAMRVIHSLKKKFDLVIFIGDSQSWCDSRAGYGAWGATSSNAEWAKYKQFHKKAKLAEIVVQPYANTQNPNSDKSIMNIGGFSDSVFDVLNEFAHRDENATFLKVVEKVEL